LETNGSKLFFVLYLNSSIFRITGFEAVNVLTSVEQLDQSKTRNS